VHDIPGNAAISPAERLARTQAIYLPWANGLHNLIAARIAAGRRPTIITIHSFTPVYHGKPRSVEFGIIHDADPTLAHAILAASGASGLNARLNEPYSAADDVTHTLRLHATPYGLANAMLEVRNDLIATPAAEAAMADRLVPADRLCPSGGPDELWRWPFCHVSAVCSDGGVDVVVDFQDLLQPLALDA